ncbi:MAG: formate dehydrogenase subunit gamma [Alcaligenes sp.]
MQTSPHAQEQDLSGLTPEEVTLQAVQEHAGQKGNLLPILHTIQDRLACIPESVVPVLAEQLALSRAEIHGVISFYAHFRTQPHATHTLEICRAEACQARGGLELTAHARRRLNCDFHENSDDGQYTLEPVYCLGLCAQSPAVMLDGVPHARVTPEKLDALLRSQEAQP